MLESLKSVNKAIAGAVVAVLVSYLVKHGIVIDGAVSEALTVVITAFIGFVLVYISPSNKPR